MLWWCSKCSITQTKIQKLYVIYIPTSHYHWNVPFYRVMYRQQWKFCSKSSLETELPNNRYWLKRKGFLQSLSFIFNDFLSNVDLNRTLLNRNSSGEKQTNYAIGTNSHKIDPTLRHSFINFSAVICSTRVPTNPVAVASPYTVCFAILEIQASIVSPSFIHPGIRDEENKDRVSSIAEGFHRGNFFAIRYYS